MPYIYIYIYTYILHIFIFCCKHAIEIREESPFEMPQTTRPWQEHRLPVPFLHEAPCHLSSSRKVARSFTKVWRTWNRETLSMSFKFRRPVDFSKPEGKGDLFESDDSCREIRRTNIVKKNDFVGFNILECLPFDVSCPLFALPDQTEPAVPAPRGFLPPNLHSSP